MTPREIDPLELLAHAIRDTVAELGPDCTGRLLGAVALDLLTTDPEPTPEMQAVPA